MGHALATKAETAAAPDGSGLAVFDAPPPPPHPAAFPSGAFDPRNADHQRGASQAFGHWFDAAHAAADPETKHTIRITRSAALHIGAVPAKLEIRFDFGTKDAGSLHHSLVKDANATWLANQASLEQSADGLDAKIKTALVKSSYEVLSQGQLPAPLSELPLATKVELRGLEAGLSLKKLDLKLLSLTTLIEGDFTTWLPPGVREHVEAKASIRVELQLDPELAKQLLDLARASDDIERSAELEADLAKTESELSRWRALETSPSELERLGPGTLQNTRRLAPTRVRELEKELDKLRGLRGKVSQARAKALQTIEKIGAKLEKRAGGKLIKKFAGKALSLVFHKFLPIWNTISTIEDIYDAGKFLAGLDWSSIGDKIMNGGHGGDHLGDGASHEGAGCDLGSADAIEQDMQRHEDVQMSPAARAVVDALEAKPGAMHRTHALTKEDEESINLAVPSDLSADELHAITEQLQAPGASEQDTVEAVISAVQHVRPFGEKPRPAAPEKPHAEAKPHGSAKRPAHEKPAGGAHILDLEGELSRRITVDPLSGKAGHPPSLVIDGVELRVDIQTARYSTEDSGFLIKARVHITNVPAGSHWRFADGGAVEPGAERVVLLSTGSDLVLHATDR